MPGRRVGELEGVILSEAPGPTSLLLAGVVAMASGDGQVQCPLSARGLCIGIRVRLRGSSFARGVGDGGWWGWRKGKRKKGQALEKLLGPSARATAKQRGDTNMELIPR